jgi:hypothetical protein
MVGFRPHYDAFVKTRKYAFFIIPAKAGIQYFQKLAVCLDPGFRRDDDVLQIHQF